MSNSHYPITPNIIKKARFLSVAGDQTRIRILCFMFDQKKACVTDIATALDMSISAISHHLQIMRDNGFFETERIDNMICYILVPSQEVKHLQQIVCK